MPTSGDLVGRAERESRLGAVGARRHDVELQPAEPPHMAW